MNNVYSQKMEQKLDCKSHDGEKLTKFCKFPMCWERVCPKCIEEDHEGHLIVEYSTLLDEAKIAKNNLLAFRASDSTSIQQIISTIKNLQTQLSESFEKHKEDAKKAEIEAISRIQRISKENEDKFLLLKNTLEKQEKLFKEIEINQNQEMLNFPELAENVINKGTGDDLRTFFEVCEKGTVPNPEILAYTQKYELLKKNIEEFKINQPFEFILAPPIQKIVQNEITPFSIQEKGEIAKNGYYIGEEHALDDSLNTGELSGPMVRTFENRNTNGQVITATELRTILENEQLGLNTPKKEVSKKKNARTVSTVPTKFTKEKTIRGGGEGKHSAKKSVCDQSSLRKMCQTNDSTEKKIMGKSIAVFNKPIPEITPKITKNIYKMRPIEKMPISSGLKIEAHRKIGSNSNNKNLHIKNSKTSDISKYTVLSNLKENLENLKAEFKQIINFTQIPCIF